jgi:septum formation protein
MTKQSFKLTLASQSPRRRQLLEEAGYRFEVLPPADELETVIYPRETPTEFVQRLAELKASDVARQVDEGIVIACDTVAECGGRILGKPRDRRHAREMLQMLRGRLHHVYSGLCLRRRPDDQTLVDTEVTKLRMADIFDDEIEDYLDTGGWRGKAGAFGLQDRHEWIQILHGSESSVVGLPMELLATMLTEMSHTR